jgi:hypothetical protein
MVSEYPRVLAVESETNDAHTSENGAQTYKVEKSTFVISEQIFLAIG